MLNVKDHKTINMFDPFDYLGPKRRKMLDESWAGIFRDHVRHILPVDLLTRYFSTGMGRPTNELVAMMGAMLLQHMHDLTDEETAEQFAFNIQWHYALDITSNSDKAAYVCPRSIWTMRSIMTEYGLYDDIFKAVGDELMKTFDADPSLQRIDSVHIFSNMKHLGRVGIFTGTIKKFLTNLKRQHKNEFKALDPDLRDRYLKKEEANAFSMVKPSESTKTLQMVADDLFFFINKFASHHSIPSMDSYQLMTRILKEQCITEQGGNTDELRVTLKPNKDIPSDSLQNPSDPDAGYSGHKGKGYQVQIAETYSTEEDAEILSLITYVDVQAAHESDADALIPYLEAAEQRGVKPEEISADTLYGSDDNHEAAKQKGVDLIAPTLDRQKGLFCTLTDFEFSENGFVISCPEQCRPVKKSRKKDRFTIAFSSERCDACPRVNHCPVKPGKKDLSYLRYNEKNVRLAQRRAYERTDEFKEKYRFRAGVEATMSQLDRRTGIKHLRVRGMKAVRFAATMKATALNIIRAAAYKKRRNKGKNPSSPSFGGLIGLILIVKEHFHNFLDKIKIAKVTSPTF
ncbi:MAG: transposase [Candidatus Electrothrix sp. GW3-4]|uniref:transposase n=1 Tax=Candidatus Electrothrix sp. GW3-4 TaxID=3126740 RepID=UPI0030CD85FF